MTASIKTQQWQMVSERRSEIYQWFSSLFALELTQSQIKAYQDGAIAPLLTFLATLGLQDEVEKLQTAIDEFKDIEDCQLELAADFAELFLLDGDDGALPYASYYTEKEGQLYGKSEALMRHFLLESGLQLHEDFKEPSDHVAVLLALLAKWTSQDRNIASSSITESAKDQYRFINDMLLNWLPLFVAKGQNIQLKSHFYQRIMELLLIFIKEDIEFLQSTFK